MSLTCCCPCKCHAPVTTRDVRQFMTRCEPCRRMKTSACRRVQGAAARPATLGPRSVRPVKCCLQCRGRVLTGEDTCYNCRRLEHTPDDMKTREIEALLDQLHQQRMARRGWVVRA